MSDTNNKPREFWVSLDESVMSMNGRHKLYTASEVPSDRDWTHVIEKRAYNELKSQAEKLARALKKIGKNAFYDMEGANMPEFKLYSDYVGLAQEALSHWVDFKAKQGEE